MCDVAGVSSNLWINPLWLLCIHLYILTRYVYLVCVTNYWIQLSLIWKIKKKNCSTQNCSIFSSLLRPPLRKYPLRDYIYTYVLNLNGTFYLNDQVWLACDKLKKIINCSIHHVFLLTAIGWDIDNLIRVLAFSCVSLPSISLVMVLGVFLVKIWLYLCALVWDHMFLCFFGGQSPCSFQ